MATFTENYSLIKPDQADYYDVADWNENMDTIDAQLAEAAAANAALLELLQGGAAKEQLYAPTETSQYALAELSTTSSYKTLKLAQFRAKHSGAILLHLKYTTTASSTTNSHTLSCYQALDSSYLELEPFAASGELNYAKSESYLSFSLRYDINEARLILPVTKGHTYYFELYTNSLTKLVVSQLDICFDVISEEDIVEFETE